MSRKRKQNYPPPKSSRRPAPAGSEESPVRPNLATIDLTAGTGRSGLSVGDRVRIDASGLHSGEIGVIERLSAGVIPSALVRTEKGDTRQVRTIDLSPAVKAPTPAPASTEAEAVTADATE